MRRGLTLESIRAQAREYARMRKTRNYKAYREKVRAELKLKRAAELAAKVEPERMK